jgi:hypothetical protein
VTDQQYAILEGRLRHLPGGIDEYVRLRSKMSSAGGVLRSSQGEGSVTDGPVTGSAAMATRLDGAQLRNVQKEIASIERRIAKLTDLVNASRASLAEHDQSDYVGLGARMAEIGALQAEAESLEERWFELTEQVG